jgi:hypothetical protein
MWSPVSPGSINFSYTPFDGPTVAFVYDDAFIINDWETALIALWALGLFTHVAGGLIHVLLVIAIVCDRGQPGPPAPNIVTD